MNKGLEWSDLRPQSKSAVTKALVESSNGRGQISVASILQDTKYF